LFWQEHVVLQSIVIKEALNRAGVPADAVDHVYMGCVIQAGLGQNVARQASIKAGLPVTTPAVTVNVVCGSGLNCVNMAAQMIIAGDADIVVAGGMENMSMAPYAAMQGRYGYRMNNASLITIAPSSAAGVVLKPPPIVPIAVRQAPAKTTFFAIFFPSIVV